LTLRHLDRLLTPASVAVFGASARPGAVGTHVWRNLRAGGFAGALLPVNLKRGELDGATVYARAADLPVVPDLAVVCTPPDTVAGIVAELGRLGTRAAIVVTAGLSPQQKQAMLDAARPHVLRLLGPNCIGALSPHIGLNASFAHTDARPGELAFVTQSGALLTAMIDWANGRGIGFSHLISLGEHCDVDFGDLLDHLADDAATRAILLYIESIEAPRKFMAAARAAARNKPVIVVKAGRAGHGVKAAASHTGAMAGADIVFDAAFRRAGMLRVDTLLDLFLAAETLARFRDNHAETLTVMTNGGGAGVMAADAAAALGVTLADPDEALLKRLDPALPANWSRGNPIDIIGDAPIERYTATLGTLLADPQAGAVLFVHAPTAMAAPEAIARACLPLIQAAPARVMGCWLGSSRVAPARALFEAAGVPDYETPEEAVRAFGMLQTYRRNQAALLETPDPSLNPAPDLPAARSCIAGAIAEHREWLSEAEAKQVLAAFGVPVVKTLVAGPSPASAAKAAGEIGFPVAVKILSPEITHKSDVGGVRLDLADVGAVEGAVHEMLERVHRLQPEAHVRGFTVQSMARRPHAKELIVGASVDPVFGPVILFGQGGTAVEVTADRAIALPPLNRSLARELVSRTRIAKLLAGYRDHPPARMDAVCDVLIAVAQMLAELPELVELDINPLWADEHGVVALDARMRIAADAPAGTKRFAIRPYPHQWVQSLAWGGRTLLVRPIRPEDEAQHRRFLDRIDAEDLRMRFFRIRREFPHSELARLTQIDYEREMALIAVAPGPDGVEETLGVVRAVRDPDNTEAEFGVLVRSDLKGSGLGRLLMTRLIECLRAQGTLRLVGLVLRENRAMLTLARTLGFLPAEGVPTEADTVRMELPLQAPSPPPER
jgi:acetyltransferase